MIENWGNKDGAFHLQQLLDLPERSWAVIEEGSSLDSTDLPEPVFEWKFSVLLALQFIFSPHALQKHNILCKKGIIPRFVAV